MKVSTAWTRCLRVLALGIVVAQPAWARSAVEQADAPPAAVSIQEAFATHAQGLRAKGTNYSMQPSSVPLVDVNGEAVLALPIIAEAGVAYTLTVHSFVMRLGRDEYVLYYPLVSLIGPDYRVQQTLKPRYEFRFEGNVLNNEFSIPAGATWLLVHTSAEFFHSDFVGSTSKGGSRGGSAASLVGGAMGGAIVMSLVQGKERPFHFGEIGQIAVLRD